MTTIQTQQPLRVAVIMGGSSFERDFSLKSGRNVCDALKHAGHHPIPLDADQNLVDTLREDRPDVAFICLHGAGGEDGSVPALLEFLSIPYVGSSSAACRASWNKPDIAFVMNRSSCSEELTASWPASVALPTSAFRDLGAAKALDLVADRVGSGYPLAVKPAHGGSAMGVSKVDKQEDLGEALMAALAFDEAALIQEWIDGVELSCAVYDNGEDLIVLPPVEIKARDGFYDTDARLNVDRVDYYCPVRQESLAQNAAEAEAIRSEIERAALEVFEAYGCRDLARVDMIWDGGRVRIMDLKTSPGLTPTSLVPMALNAADISLESLLDELVIHAFEREC